MPHTYVSCECHCIFGAKERSPVLAPDLRGRLFEYIAAVARKFGIHLIAIGGVEDHIHLLIGLPATMSIAGAMKLIKGSTARWIHQTFPEAGDFAWQEGYGAFSVSRSLRPNIIEYIHGQEEHHKRISFEAELNTLLQRHGFPKNPQSAANKASTSVD